MEEKMEYRSAAAFAYSWMKSAIQYISEKLKMPSARSNSSAGKNRETRE